MNRVVTYIDGFNLYYSLRAKEWRHCYWLDVHRLAEELLAPGQTLLKVAYFTSRISVRRRHPGDTDRQTRQNTYLDALGTLDDVEIHYGRHAHRERTCPECEAMWQQPEEKMTDVNIAVQVLGDAQDDLFDAAMIISGDTDLVGLVQAIRRRYPEKAVVVVFPGRHSAALKNAASAVHSLSEKAFASSQLPERVTTTRGYTLVRPASWV